MRSSAEFLVRAASEQAVRDGFEGKAAEATIITCIGSNKDNELLAVEPAIASDFPQLKEELGDSYDAVVGPQ